MKKRNIILLTFAIISIFLIGYNYKIIAFMKKIGLNHFSLFFSFFEVYL